MRRLAILAAALLAALVLAGCGGGDGSDAPPAAGAARLVPADALVYLHLSTDGDRAGVRRATKLLARFPGYPGLRDSLLRRLAGAAGSVDFKRDVRPWLGKEAALALLNTTGSTAGSLLIAAVSDTGKARAFLDRVSSGAAARYRGAEVRRYGRLEAAISRGYLVVGQAASLRRALDLAAGRGASLATNRVFRRATAPLPAGRVLDAWASADGVGRLLVPQGGLLGAAGALLDNPALKGTALALTAEKPGARLTVHSILDPRVNPNGRLRPFEPRLLDAVPEDAIGYLGLTGLDRAASPLLNLAAPVIGELRARLERGTGLSLRRDVLPLFRGEVAIAITPRVPTPVLTLIAPATDAARTARAFAKLRPPLAKLLGLRISSAVVDGRLVVSTDPAGIAAVRAAKGGLPDAAGFDATLGQRPGRVTSLVFLDFEKLLTLAERTGLSDSPTYQRVREDLQQVEAVGVESTGGEGETTAELRFQIR